MILGGIICIAISAYIVIILTKAPVAQSDAEF